MKLRLKTPKFVMSMASKYLSKILTEELECNVLIQINEAEVGMRNKRFYSHMNVDADIDRADLWKLIKNYIKG